MTAATEGRTYMIKSLVLDPDIASGKRFPANGYYTTNADYTEIETPLVVPNGKWVAQRPSSPSGWSWLVGVASSELVEVKLDTRYGGFYNILYVCDKPFGFVRKDMPWSEERLNESNTYRSHLTAARQIHKGELGQSVPIPHVKYVRQPFDENRKLGMKARERRRGQHGWIQLSELGEAAVVGYDSAKWIELVLGYWQFSGHLCYENHEPVGTLVDVVRGSSLDIKLGTVKVESLTPERFRQEDGYDMWIRRGFAFTILRLLALGVKPTVPQFV